MTNIIIIETSVLALYLLIHYLILNSSLLCTSSWRFEICLPPIYDPIEFSPNDLIQSKLFVSINGIDIYISSHKLLLNRLISMEVRLSTFPFSCWCDNFPFQLLIILKNFLSSRAIAQLSRVSHKISPWAGTRRKVLT